MTILKFKRGITKNVLTRRVMVLGVYALSDNA